LDRIHCVAQRLKKEYSCTTTPTLSVRGLFQGELYFYFTFTSLQHFFITREMSDLYTDHFGPNSLRFKIAGASFQDMSKNTPSDNSVNF